MKKIVDERLKIQNLKNTRIAYVIQTLGILGILVFDAVTKGIDGMRDNPLWLVFMATTIVSAYLSMSISVEHENVKKPFYKNSLYSIIVLLLISTLIGVLVSNSKGFGMSDGFLLGGILFICGIISIIYVSILRKKQLDEVNEED